MGKGKNGGLMGALFGGLFGGSKKDGKEKGTYVRVSTSTHLSAYIYLYMFICFRFIMNISTIIHQRLSALHSSTAQPRPAPSTTFLYVTSTTYHQH